MDPQSSSLLFLLPYEIRLAIYELYLLPSNQPDYYLCTPTPIETFLARGPFRRDNIPGLVLVCKRLHAELRALVFDTITFVVRDSYHRGSTALGSFGLLNFSRIRKVVYVMERTTAFGWREDWHLHVFVRNPEEKGGWWFRSAVRRLITRHGEAAICKDVKQIPALTGLKEVVFFWGASSPWFDPLAKWPHARARDAGLDYERQFLGKTVWAIWPVLDHLASLRGVETIRLGGHYGDSWASYLEQKTTARILLEGRQGANVSAGIGARHGSEP